MTKAKTIDRLELTRRKMAFREMVKHMNEVPAAPGVEDLPQRKEHECPNCGSEMQRFEGCWRCPKCGVSLC